MEQIKKFISYFNFCDEWKNQGEKIKHYEECFRKDFFETILKNIIDTYMDFVFSNLLSFFYCKDYNEFLAKRIHICFELYKANSNLVAYTFENINFYSDTGNPIIIESKDEFYERFVSTLLEYGIKLYTSNENERYNMLKEPKYMSSIAEWFYHGVRIEFDTTIGQVIDLVKTEMEKSEDYENLVNKLISDNYNEWVNNVYKKIFHEGFLDQFWKRLIFVLPVIPRGHLPKITIEKSSQFFEMTEYSNHRGKGKYDWAFKLGISDKYYDVAISLIQSFIAEYYNYVIAEDWDKRKCQLLAGYNIDIEDFGHNWGVFFGEDIKRMQELYDIEKAKLDEINLPTSTESEIKDNIKKLIPYNSHTGNHDL